MSRVKSIPTIAIASAVLAVAVALLPKPSLADQTKETLIKTSSLTREQLKFSSALISSGYTCDSYWINNGSDQSGSYPFNPDHCVNEGYRCVVTAALPFNDGIGRAVTVGPAANDEDAGSKDMTDEACHEKMENFYNSLGSKPLQYSIYIIDENARMIRMEKMSDSNYYFYNGK